MFNAKCYKTGHGASFCYHCLDENYVPSLPPPASTVQLTSSALPSQQIQDAQPVQYVVPSSQYPKPVQYVAQPQYAYIQPPPQAIQAPKQQTNSPQIFLTSSVVTPS